MLNAKRKEMLEAMRYKSVMVIDFTRQMMRAMNPQVAEAYLEDLACQGYATKEGELYTITDKGEAAISTKPTVASTRSFVSRGIYVPAKQVFRPGSMDHEQWKSHGDKC